MTLARQARRKAWQAWPALDLPHGLFIAVALVMGYFVFPPLIALLITSFQATQGLRVTGFTLGWYHQIFSGSGATAIVVGNTLLFGVGSSLLGLTMGSVLAWLVERTDSPFKAAVSVTALVSLAIPGIVKVIGWILLLGPEAGLINVALRSLLHLSASPFSIYSMGGMVLVEGIVWTPLVFLLMSVPFRAMDPALEEAASVSGAGLWKTTRRITLQMARPAILSMLILTVIRSIASFDTPALIGVPARIPVLTTQVYNAIHSGVIPQYGAGSAYAMLLTLVVVILLVPYLRLTTQSQAFATITGKAYRPRRIELGRWRFVAGAFSLLLPVLVILPLAVLFWASLLPYYQAPSAQVVSLMTFGNYAKAFQNSGVLTALRNTFTVALSSGTGVMLVAFLAAWVTIRTRVRLRWILDNLGTFPLVFPGVVLGIAVLRTYLTLPIPIYSTIWILVAAYLTAYLSYGIRFAETGLLQINKELEESGQTSGARFSTVMRRIVMPLMMPALFGGWIYVFLLSAKEFSIAVLLYGPRSRVISVAIWEEWQNGQVPELAAFCIGVAAIFVSLALVFNRFSHRYELAV